MTRHGAAVQLKRMFGPTAIVDVGPKPTSPESRRQACHALTEITRQLTEAHGAARKRAKALIGADVEYRRLHKTYQALWRQREAVKRERESFRFKAFKREHHGDVLLAQGDTWEEVFAQLTKRATSD